MDIGHSAYELPLHWVLQATCPRREQNAVNTSTVAQQETNHALPPSISGLSKNA